MEYSDRQKVIFDTYQNTNKNIVIEATAGSGKTFCLTECCKRTPPFKKVLFMAFNKSIADELRSKLPTRCTVGTFHSMGLKVLLKNFRFKMKLDENKTFKIGMKYIDTEKIPQKQRLRYLMELQDIWNAIRINLLVDYKKDIPNICIDKDIEFRERMIEDICVIEKHYNNYCKKINDNKEFCIDFTDMLYLPYIILSEDDFPKFDVVMVDELQDQNCLQRELILRYIKRGGRFVQVGDKKQSIYCFTGSSISNFETIQRFFNTVTLPLDITYRCSRKIVEEAQKVFPEGIVAAEGAEEGSVVENGDYRKAQDGDFILCRNNLPLIDVFINLLSLNKKVSIKGKDFGVQLCSIIEKIKKIDDLDNLLKSKLQDLINKGIPSSAAQKNQSYLNLLEKTQIIKRLYSVWKGDLNSLKEVVETIYTDNTEGIILSTIHKSKGLETDNVYFLKPDLIPSPYITTEEMAYSEKCLKFVAITRARKNLIYCK